MAFKFCVSIDYPDVKEYDAEYILKFQRIVINIVVGVSLFLSLSHTHSVYFPRYHS